MTRGTVSRDQVLPPPTARYTLLGWAYKNLFSTWYNSLLTILSFGLIFIIVRSFFTWLLIEAEWEVVQVNLRLLMVGQYPIDQAWRVWLCLQLLAATAGLSWGIWVRRRWLLAALLVAAPLVLAFLPAVTDSARQQLLIMDAVAIAAFGLGRLKGSSLRQTAISLWAVYLILVIFIIRGVDFLGDWIPVVPTNLWGGLLLTFLLTVVGIVFSFPLGILLALGRRSHLPAIRWASIVYIEFIRGVPLVTILFMASTMVPLFFPVGMRPDPVLRAMVGITLFSAAYMAENVRGGLQAIPFGQYEASQALGLSGFLTMALIILPQAIRMVIPVLVGLFIALFKDTSLVATIGLLELLGISRSILAQPQYVGMQHEVYLFISLIYWVISYLMSYISQRLEVAMGKSSRL